MADAEVIELGEPMWLLYAFLSEGDEALEPFLHSFIAGALAQGADVKARVVSEEQGPGVVFGAASEADARELAASAWPSIVHDGKPVEWRFEIKRGVWHIPPEERLENEIFDMLADATVEQLQKTRDFVKELFGV